DLGVPAARPFVDGLEQGRKLHEAVTVVRHADLVHARRFRGPDVFLHALGRVRAALGVVVVHQVHVVVDHHGLGVTPPFPAAASLPCAGWVPGPGHRRRNRPRRPGGRRASRPRPRRRRPGLRRRAARPRPNRQNRPPRPRRRPARPPLSSAAGLRPALAPAAPCSRPKSPPAGRGTGPPGGPRPARARCTPPPGAAPCGRCSPPPAPPWPIWPWRAALPRPWPLGRPAGRRPGSDQSAPRSANTPPAAPAAGRPPPAASG